MEASDENVRHLAARNLHCAVAEVPLLELFALTMAALASRNEVAGRQCLVTHPRCTGFQVNYVRTS
jgi:ABC-type sulfate transport system permease subunit